MTDLEMLEKRLEEVNVLIQEAESRLGAHSVKAVLMQELFALEEERDEIVKKIDRLGASPFLYIIRYREKENYA